MSKLTGTHSEVSAIDFTTLTTVPGTVKVHGAPIQILDLREWSDRRAYAVAEHGRQLVSLKERMMDVDEVDKVSFDILTSCGSISTLLQSLLVWCPTSDQNFC